jgi:tetratricopeptide (TPR) repeat protein
MRTVLANEQPMNYDAWRHYLRGNFFVWIRQPRVALQAYRDALAADPSMVKAARVAGFLLAEQHDYRGAEAMLRRAVELDPEDAGTWFNLGYACEHAGQRREAIAAFEKAVAFNPKLDRAWYGLGFAHAQLGEHEAAAKALEEAAIQQPMNGQAWYALGMAHHHCHRPERVKEVVEHIVRYDAKMARQLIRETERADLAHLVAHLQELPGA